MLFRFKSVETILYQITPKTFELIELQCDSTLKEKFKTERIDRFYALLNKSKFVNLKKMAMKLLVLFGSTYICEQTFSTMNINKSKLCSNLIDINLQS